MGRTWTAAAVLLATIFAGAAVARAQEERPAPAQEVQPERSPDPAPAPAAPVRTAVVPPAQPAGGPAAEPRSAGPWRTTAFSDDDSGQATARPRTGGSTASAGSSGRRAPSGSSGSADSRGRARSPGGAVSAPSGGSRGGGVGDVPSSSSAERRRYPARNPDGSVTTGYAVRRGSVRPPYGGAGWYYPSHPWYGSWYPYGYGSWGLGFYMWDPYWYGGWGAPYAYGYGYSAAYYDTGAVRTLIKPRDAQVFVDGYYVGIVDEFDGAFQRLRLETGPHRIEIRKEGFETMRFDVRVVFGHTINLRGELRPAEPTP